MILVRAPLRLPLGGGGTDLPSYYREFGGSLTTATIDKFVYVAVNRPPLDDLIRVKYSYSEEVARVDDLRHDLVRPALQHLGFSRQIEIASLADVSAGTGLGSSSAYLVALLLALETIRGRTIATQDLAELACHIEMDIARHPVGKQDQYAAAFGGIISMSIARDGAVAVTPVTLPGQAMQLLDSRLLMFSTGIQRNANETLNEQVAELTRPDGRAVDAMHETREIGEAIKTALVAGDTDRFGVLLHDHWEAKKRRSQTVSVSQIDCWYAMARNGGATGGKLVGAGGGGFLMLYVLPDAAASVRTALMAEGLVEMNYHFDSRGAEIMTGSR